MFFDLPDSISRGSVPGILARDSTDDILAQNASIANDRLAAPAVGFADGWLDNGAKNGTTLLFAPLGGRAGGVAQAGSGETRTGYVRGARRGWGLCRSRCRGVRLPWKRPTLPWLSMFPELNVRTYVNGREGRPGCMVLQPGRGESCWAVELARLWFHLPYFKAQMSATSKVGGNRIFLPGVTIGGAENQQLQVSYSGQGSVLRGKTGNRWSTS